MNVVGHQAEGVHTVSESAGPLLEQEIKTVPILIGEENGLASVTAKDYVVEPAREVDAWFSSHGVNIPVHFNLSTWKPDPEVF
jgi:hypothetical protein